MNTQSLKVYYVDGSFLGTHEFLGGQPLVGDCFMMDISDVQDLQPGMHLVYVFNRRWTDDGELELVVDTETQD